MHVFLTSAHGFVGSRITPLLLKKGHTVSGLARSESTAEKLKSMGVEPVYSTLQDTGKLHEEAKKSDAVIHTAFQHEFDKYEEMSQQDRKAVEALLKGLDEGEGKGKNSDKVFIYTSVPTAGIRTPGERLKEDQGGDKNLGTRSLTEQYVIDYTSSSSTTTGDKSKLRTTSIRLASTVHGDNDPNFIPALIKYAKEKKVAGYVDAYKNDQGVEIVPSWSAVHVDDAAQLYIDVLEKGKNGHRYHASSEEVVTLKSIAEFIAGKLGVESKKVEKEEIGDYIGFLAWVGQGDSTLSSEMTKKEVGWEPKGKALFEDMEKGDYFK